MKKFNFKSLILEILLMQSKRGFIGLCILVLLIGVFLNIGGLVGNLFGFTIFGILGLSILYMFIIGIKNMLK